MLVRCVGLRCVVFPAQKSGGNESGSTSASNSKHPPTQVVIQVLPVVDLSCSYFTYILQLSFLLLSPFSTHIMCIPPLALIRAAF